MLLGEQRLAFPDNHIEADNRLSWFLGRLDQKYGDSAFYVHLTRDIDQTAASFAKRYSRGIIHSYRKAILQYLPESSSPIDVSRDYCETVNSNIEMFLGNKSMKMKFDLANAKEDFRLFWKQINAEGDLDAALAEFDRKHNATGKSGPIRGDGPGLIRRAFSKIGRVSKALPEFVRNA
jgi:hypothetical protein